MSENIIELDKLEYLNKKYPGIEVIIGRMRDDDKGIPINLLEMEVDRTKSIDAATEYLFGKRSQNLEKLPVFTPAVYLAFALGSIVGIIITYFLT